jgi:hypothetical protein
LRRTRPRVSPLPIRSFQPRVKSVGGRRSIVTAWSDPCGEVVRTANCARIANADAIAAGRQSAHHHIDDHAAICIGKLGSADVAPNCASGGPELPGPLQIIKAPGGRGAVDQCIHGHQLSHSAQWNAVRTDAGAVPVEIIAEGADPDTAAAHPVGDGAGLLNWLLTGNRRCLIQHCHLLLPGGSRNLVGILVRQAHLEINR